MLNIKLWWSIFVPKDQNNFINTDYLNNFKNFLNKVTKKNYILHHGTWNVWHWFIKKYWLSNSTYDIWKSILNQYFSDIDKIFNLKRINAYDIIQNNVNYDPKVSYITWGDISPDLRIISSDETFSKTFWLDFVNTGLILTDVDWVIDQEWNIISHIDNTSFNQIHFWTKKNDVTGSMHKKVENILKTINWKWKKVWIANWTNFDNIYEILTNDKWIWTQILI